MANTHHTGIPLLQWAGAYPPCTPSVVISADINPFCAGDSVTFTPTLSCVTGVTITAYAWVLNGVIVSASSSPYVNAALNDGDTVYFLFTTSDGNTYFSNVITMVEKIINCPAEIKYGLLYNHYAITDARSIVSAGDFVIPTLTQLNTLRDYLGGFSVTGGKLKETGLVYWSSNVGATNEVGFFARGTGHRTELGAFQSIQGLGYITSLTEAASSRYYMNIAGSSIAANTNYLAVYKRGMPYRLMRDATVAELLLPDGLVSAQYTDPSGYIYRCTKIGTQIWTISYLITQHYATGEAIVEVSDTTDWAALSTGALCAYDNDWSNVMI